VHINNILSGKVRIHDFQILNWGGGFLDGDDLGSGRAGADRLKFSKIKGKTTFVEELQTFVSDGKLVGGQCNGFQLFVKTGILPQALGSNQEVSLTQNESGKFEDRWVNITVPERSRCIWTRGIRMMRLPVRHGEGRLVFAQTQEGAKIRETLKRDGLIAAQYSDEYANPTDRYPENPNGSQDAIAALTDRTGRIFALMPHPEAFSRAQTDPYWTIDKARHSTSQQGQGMQIFMNAVKYITEEWK
jgi:phosphoribosylformylglycinamidine synthase subunit PurQ / glutaminase